LLAVDRFLLGVAESAIFPAMLVLLPRCVQCMLSVAGKLERTFSFG
jgi:hypothetical protein